MAQILIIEDETLLAKSISRYLTTKGHDCYVAGSAEEGLRLMEKMKMDVALLDLQLPGMSGLEAIKRMRVLDPELVVIISTAYGTMAAAVDAMRCGASDFLRKPLDMEEVSLAVERALSTARIKRTMSYYHDREGAKVEQGALICFSPKMKQVEELLRKITAINLPSLSDYPPTLILGETGTGKDLMARTIHYHGQMAEQPFVEVNCSTLPKGLEEAELFGYERGAFTGADRPKRGLFEAASGGSIFLNEIGDLTPEAQVKLLQVIERKSLRRIGGLRDISLEVRIIAATNRNLEDASAFRQDLYFRLHNLTIEVPPLRERKEDIPHLAAHFLELYGCKYSARKKFDSGALELLISYQWPGNVRELRQLIERVTFLTSGEIVSAADLNLPSSRTARAVVNKGGEIEVTLQQDGVDLESLIREVIVKTLDANGGNVSKAARKLSIGREALRYRIRKHGIPSS